MATTRPRIGVAFSGGLDSTVLLHVAQAACAPLGVEVVALHVHHGLQPAADGWLAHCERFCAERALRCVTTRLQGGPPRGASIEAWAREGRYAALAAMARADGIDLVLLAHHRRDQAETWLLQALRGAGLAGLAAMPRQQRRDGITWARPFLAVPREALLAHAAMHGLPAVDDPANADPRFDRSRLRLQVWPALLAAFPQAEAALAASAARAAEAASLVDEVAAQELQGVCDDGALVVADWAMLSLPRRVAVLRAWLRSAMAAPASASLVDRLLAALPGARTARWPVAHGELRLHRGRLGFAAAASPPAAGAPRADAPGPVVPLSITRAGRRRIAAWRGQLVLTRVDAGGVALAALAQAELRPRSGGEDFQRGPGRPARSLKKQWQAAGVPAWSRAAPLLWAGGRLVFVPGLGVDARAVAAAGVPQVTIAWEPDQAG
jgi:tRNA(Ile)-lysidine synthase